MVLTSQSHGSLTEALGKHSQAMIANTSTGACQVTRVISGTVGTTIYVYAYQCAYISSYNANGDYLGTSVIKVH